jgi:hypothetical protein
MRIRTNLALYPAAARRRSNWLLLSAMGFGLALTAIHIAWAYSGTASPSELRGEAELLGRESAILRTRLEGLQETLDPVVVRDLSDRVRLANDFIYRGAVDPVALMALIETSAPAGLVLDRLSLTSSEDGVRAELTVRGNQSEVSALVEALGRHDSIHDIAPLSEQIAAGADQIVLALRYRPRELEGR